MATTPVVVGGNVEGNIGQCEIKSTSVDVSSFYTRTFATNSCTGEVISDVTYYDWGYIYYPVAIGLVVFVFFASIKWLSNLD